MDKRKPARGQQATHHRRRADIEKLYVFSRRRKRKDREVDGQEILAAIIGARNGWRTIYIQQFDGHPSRVDIAIGADGLRGVGETDDGLKRLTWPVEDAVTQVDRYIDLEIVNFTTRSLMLSLLGQPNRPLGAAGLFPPSADVQPEHSTARMP